MEDRLLKLMDAEQLSSAKFADVIGVQRSSISHILSGRNKPSFDFLQKTLKAFPVLNADWLILGEGKMYETGEQIGGGSLFDQPTLKPRETEADINDMSEISSPEEQKEEHISPVIGKIDEIEASGEDKIEGSSLAPAAKKVQRVILLYSDNSFISYEPGD